MVTVQDGTRTYRLTGRVKEMVLYLARQRLEQLNSAEKVRLEFNCSGAVVRPKIELYEEAIEISQ